MENVIKNNQLYVDKTERLSQFITSIEFNFFTLPEDLVKFLKIVFALGVVGGLTIFLVIIGCNEGKETTNSGSSTSLKVSLNSEPGYLVKLSWDSESDKIYMVTYNQEDQVNVSGEVGSDYYGARERGFKKGDCWTIEEKGSGKKG